MRSPVSVTQDWVQRLSFMQQSVLLAAVRGPDGVEKNAGAKAIIRWYRRSVLYSAFESRKAGRPARILNWHAEGGGSFTGPSPFGADDEVMVKAYVDSLDALPHHFQTHMMHAAEVVGYKHDDPGVRWWWHKLYVKLARQLHLAPETEAEMDKRLGDSEEDWRSFDIAAVDG